MKRNRLFYKTALFFASFSLVTLRANDEMELAADRDGDGKNAFSYIVDKSIFDHQPSWQAGKQACPLALEDALRIALLRLEKQTWKKDVYLKQISLSYVRNTNFEKWFYTFSFDTRVFRETPTADEFFKVKHPSAIIVLLDGSIVEPKDVR